MVKKKFELTSEAFEKLLAWLDPDPNLAGQKYEDIRLKLIKFFARRGRNNPEDLADKTIDRVIRKVPEVAPSYKGDPVLYFYSVAKYILLEPVDDPSPTMPPPEAYSSEEKERRHARLEKCLAELKVEERTLLLKYYTGEKGDKKRGRKELAKSLGISIEALRTRVSRVMVKLAECMKRPLSKSG